MSSRYDAGGVQLIWNVGDRIDQLAAGSLISHAALGLYAIAVRFQDGANSIPTIITTAYQPWFVDGLRSPQREHFARRTLLVLITLTSVCGAVLALLGPVVITRFLPHEYAVAQKYVLIFAVSLVANAPQILGIFLLRGAAGTELPPRYSNTVYGIRTTVLVVASLIAATVGGVLALAATVSIINLVFYSGMLRAILGRMSLRLGVAELLPPLLGLAGIGIVLSHQNRYACALISLIPGLLAGAMLNPRAQRRRPLDGHQ